MSDTISIRENFERQEKTFMSPFGCRSADSRGRVLDEAPSPIRTAFQVDRDRIVYSNAFRRLKHKTQVFLRPLGDAYRTRLTHTLEVAQIARSVARAMLLNEDLAEAIALGHDLGHTPFGHSGEAVLREIFSKTFSHQVQSLRVVEVLENNGKGLNLTIEVRDGMQKHSKGYGKIIPDDPGKMASTLEGRIVRIADIMAYLNHDLDDAVRSGVVAADQVPRACIEILGETHWERATNMINDLVFSSNLEADVPFLSMSDRVYGAMTILRKFLYQNVYRSPKVHGEFVKAKKILTELYAYFLENEAMLKEEVAKMEMSGIYENGDTRERVVCDLIASMTDRYAMRLYEKIFFPAPMI